jgi:UDP-N-acetyl-D-mannosaminuronic acid transferase (WecB/TagA/CpsF family)
MIKNEFLNTNRMKFLNTEIDNLTMQESLEVIEKLIKRKNPSYVVTPNVDHIVKLEEDAEFQKVYANADLILSVNPIILPPRKTADGAYCSIG